MGLHTPVLMTVKELLVVSSKTEQKGQEEQPMTKYFFGNQSFVGKEITIQTRKTRNKEKSKVVVVYDRGETKSDNAIIVVKYTPGYKEAFTKQDVLAGDVVFFL